MCVRVHMCAHVFGGPEVLTRCLSQSLCTSVFDPGSPKLTGLARLAPRVGLLVSPQHSGALQLMLPCLAFVWVLGVQTSGPQARIANILPTGLCPFPPFLTLFLESLEFTD